MGNFNTIVVMMMMMVIYAICHSTALLQDFSTLTHTHHTIQGSLKDIQWLSVQGLEHTGHTVGLYRRSHGKQNKAQVMCCFCASSCSDLYGSP